MIIQFYYPYQIQKNKYKRMKLKQGVVMK